jgi:sulfofructose kinase
VFAGLSCTGRFLSVATALVALARLGADCSFYGVIGDDPEGEKIQRSLMDEGVNVSGLLTRTGAVSQTAFIAIEKRSGKRTIFWRRPSGTPLDPYELPNGFLLSADFLLLDGLMKDVSIRSASIANAMNLPVMLDAGGIRDGMIEIARLCDYVVASEEFAKELARKTGNSEGAEGFRAAVRELGTGIITITLGKRGSITFAGDQTIAVPVYDVEVLDTTGAGDVFHGGYIYGLLQNWDIKTTVRFASAMAAMKCMKIGGRAGIPDLARVREFMKARGETLPEQ